MLHQHPSSTVFNMPSSKSNVSDQSISRPSSSSFSRLTRTWHRKRPSQSSSSSYSHIPKTPAQSTTRVPDWAVDLVHEAEQSDEAFCTHIPF
ncbi:unnamed protein product [Chondrus crispus]|uniref:Uncharacterized protein n=1 Tax=Chondrus crispus TaxID=2769 RepID=R7QLU2_CHOCR|nr:unnamed protein product [Chondrus crispus]CDF38360.1 unnamed protein product [Chondrus crispus]|eukprot:XP_005718245.1 unnamed protein product [Chondrus crispus]